MAPRSSLCRMRRSYVGEAERWKFPELFRCRHQRTGALTIQLLKAFYNAEVWSWLVRLAEIGVIRWLPEVGVILRLAGVGVIRWLAEDDNLDQQLLHHCGPIVHNIVQYAVLHLQPRYYFTHLFTSIEYKKIIYF
uniref:Uncharacterized protein n=1 Tax=Anopheles funestus TaxID=62324 RepID=A0A4Y0BI33_ANOFN